MHPEISKVVKRLEENAMKAGSYRTKLGKNELIFLEMVMGPVLQYNFDDLEAEYPLKDFKGGDRFVDFIYSKGGMHLALEIDGFTTHARDISPGDFSDHLMRQNDLILQGWMILRFSTHLIEKQPTICQRQIMQAIGHWWTLTHNYSFQENDVWQFRTQQLIQFALSQNGLVRNIEIARYFGIPVRTARDWVARFVSADVLIPIRPNKRIISYQLQGYKKK